MNQNIIAKGDDTMTATAPFRYDIVGSFLRPASLKAARKAFEEGTLSPEALSKAEDEAILDLVERKKPAASKPSQTANSVAATGIWTFWLPLMVSREVHADHWSVAFKGAQPKASTIAITGKLILRTIPS